MGKRGKRAALRERMRQVPNLETILNIMIDFGGEFWNRDPDKDRVAAIKPVFSNAPLARIQSG